MRKLLVLSLCLLLTACAGQEVESSPVTTTLPAVPTPDRLGTQVVRVATVVTQMETAVAAINVTAQTATPLYGTAVAVWATATAPTPAPVRTIFDLNIAPREALVAITGIGPALAEKIEAYRRDTEIKRLDDLLLIVGIGPATVNLIRNCQCTRQK